MGQIVNQELIDDFKSFIESRKDSILSVAPSHISHERIVRLAINAVIKTPSLLECDRGSLYLAVLQAATLGLEPNGALGHCYILPFREKGKQTKTAMLMPGYQGYIELAYRSGLVRDIMAQVVLEGDEFDYELGSAPFIRHRLNEDNRGQSDEVRFAYMVANTLSGGKVIDVMTFSELEYNRSKSFAKDSPAWAQFPLEMYRKTVIRRGQKYLPRSPELSQLSSLDVAADKGDRSYQEFDFDQESIDQGELPEPQPKHGTNVLMSKMGIKTAAELADDNPDATPEERAARPRDDD